MSPWQGHPKHLCVQMLSAGGMISLWLFSSFGPAFVFYPMAMCRSNEAGASVLGTEAVSLEMKVICGN